MPNASNGLPYDRVAIIGVGLIGGSIGLGLLRRGLARSVIGIGRNATRLQNAVDLGAITDAAVDLAAGVADAELIVVCTPVDSIVDFVVAAAAAAPANVLITDGGSTKRQIVEEAESRLGTKNVFVGSHPMAGSERTGVEFADPDLYVGHNVIVTETPQTDRERTSRCRLFWQSLGANVQTMAPAEHDSVVSSISHSPHVIAALLAAATPEAHLPFASTGWQDTTRVASGSVDMWNQIIQQNKASLQDSLSQFQRLLERFSDALAEGDVATIRQMLEEGKSKRDAVAS